MTPILMPINLFNNLYRNLLHHMQSCRKKITYITENLIGLSGTNSVLLFWVASPLVQVGAVEDIAQHVLAPLGYLVSDNIRREVDLGLGLMVVLLVDPLSGQNIID